MKEEVLKEYRELLKNAELLRGERIAGWEERPVRGLASSLWEAVRDGMFLCNGSAFREEALAGAAERGCFCYVSETPYQAGQGMAFLRVRDIAQAEALLASAFYDAAKLPVKITGITGTNGKTTAAHYLRSILDAWERQKGGRPTGILSSMETFDGRESGSFQTVSEPAKLYRRLNRSGETGQEYMTVELSERMLKSYRACGIPCDVGILLNIAEDSAHFEGHESFEESLRTVSAVFRNAKTACVNLDTEHRRQVLAAAGSAERIVTFGTTGAPDIWGHAIHMENGKVTFQARCDRFHEKFTLAMPGFFNVENALAAIAAAYAYEIPVSCIREGLALATVSGRMEEYERSDRKLHVIVDCAQNRLSLERLFDDVCLRFPGWRIAAVFGCPGDRGKNLRRELGLVAGLFAQKLYITADNPGMEPVERISGEICHYAEMVGCPCACIRDRAEAVNRAVAEAEERTVVLVLGKGNAGRQRFGAADWEYPADAALVCRALDWYASCQRIPSGAKIAVGKT